MARDSGGCEICSAAAARPKCSRSATAKKYRNCHNSGRSIPTEYYSSTATALDCRLREQRESRFQEDTRMAATPANRRSRLITHGVARSPNRAMLRAVGFGDGDFEKPIVGVANGHSTMNPVQRRHPAARRPRHGRARAGGRQAAGVRRADGHRRHRHGHRGDEVLAGLARGDRRRDRDQRQRPGDGRGAGGRRAATRTCPAA